jgi:selenocysteine-specific elongation factor
MIIGTAGHIDHGKTSLVKALTGVDADRLPEEQARGMTIDLGFAYTSTESKEIIGFVDVPGHEKFVHTMAAGAVGMDHGLLVVAADDGIMPQTREHLRILDLLGVAGLTVAITKADMVDEARAQQVRDEVAHYVAQTRFGQVDSHVVSARQGQGLAELKQALFTLAVEQPLEQASYFRLAIDRVFVVKGLGVAVTGAVIAGQVQVGDTLTLAHAGREVRVRSIHAQNQNAETAGVGQRCGLVLTGVELAEVQRGDWLLASQLNRQTARIDCLLSVPSDGERSLKDGERVLLHHGCEHVAARLILLESNALLPGQSGFAQCVLDRALPFCWHDRLVLRDGSARVTLAGAQVLDIAPPVRARKTPERLGTLQVLCQSSAAEVIGTLLQTSLVPIALEYWAFAMNREPRQLIESLKESVAVTLKVGQVELVLGADARATLSERLRSSLQAFHAAEPDEPGVALERLRRMALPFLDASVFKAWAQYQIDSGAITLTGSFAHLPEHRITLSAGEQILWQKILPKMLEQGFDPPWVRDLALSVSASEDSVRTLLKKQARTSLVVQLVKDLFYPHTTMVALANVLRALLQLHGAVSVVQFRDTSGLGRKRAIQVLEAFDRIGLTRRVVANARQSRGAEKDHRIVRNAGLFVETDSD